MVVAEKSWKQKSWKGGGAAAAWPGAPSGDARAARPPATPRSRGMLPESFMISCPVVLLSRRPGAGSRDCLAAHARGGDGDHPSPGVGVTSGGPEHGRVRRPPFPAA